MPLNKSALLRYRIIDACLTNGMRHYPTLEQIQEKIESELDVSISTSIIGRRNCCTRLFYRYKIETGQSTDCIAGTIKTEGKSVARAKENGRCSTEADSG